MIKLISENPKATVTALVGAIVAIVVWILSFFGITVPLEIAAAFGVVLMFFLGRYTRINKEEAEAIKEL